MDIQLIITIAGIILNVGVIYGVLKANMKTMEDKVNELQTTIYKFGERMNSSERDIAGIKAVCDERHK